MNGAGLVVVSEDIEAPDTTEFDGLDPRQPAASLAIVVAKSIQLKCPERGGRADNGERISDLHRTDDENGTFDSRVKPNLTRLVSNYFGPILSFTQPKQLSVREQLLDIR